jgi:hypothetical protein
MSSEYSGQSSTNQSACSFATLGTYNQMHGNGLMNPVAPNPSALQTAGVYIVPNYEAIGYDAFGSRGSCNGFLNVTDAYGKNANKCSTQYFKRVCQ